MLINGEEKALACPTVLSELLTQLGYRAAFVAIELNGNIIKQADLAVQQLPTPINWKSSAS